MDEHETEVSAAELRLARLVASAPQGYGPSRRIDWVLGHGLEVVVPAGRLEPLHPGD